MDNKKHLKNVGHMQYYTIGASQLGIRIRIPKSNMTFIVKKLKYQLPVGFPCECEYD